MYGNGYSMAIVFDHRSMHSHFIDVNAWQANKEQNVHLFVCLSGPDTKFGNANATWGGGVHCCVKLYFSPTFFSIMKRGWTIITYLSVVRLVVLPWLHFHAHFVHPLEITSSFSLQLFLQTAEQEDNRFGSDCLRLCPSPPTWLPYIH